MERIFGVGQLSIMLASTALSTGRGSTASFSGRCEGFVQPRRMRTGGRAVAGAHLRIRAEAPQEAPDAQLQRGGTPGHGSWWRRARLRSELLPRSLNVILSRGAGDRPGGAAEASRLRNAAAKLGKHQTTDHRRKVCKPISGKIGWATKVEKMD